MSFEFSLGVRFSAISMPLVDVTKEGCRAREELAEIGAFCQTVGGLGICAGVVATCFGLYLAKSYPKTAALTASVGVIGVLASREAYVLGRNTCQVMLDDIFSRAANASSPQKFVNAMTKDSLLIGPLLGPTLVKALKERNPSKL